MSLFSENLYVQDYLCQKYLPEGKGEQTMSIATYLLAKVIIAGVVVTASIVVLVWEIINTL